MARQYKPIRITVNNFPVIIYPAKDEVSVTAMLPTKKELTQYVEEIFTENANICRGDYAIAFIWNNGIRPMADIWIYSENTHSNSGPILENFPFSNKEQSVTGDIATGDSVIALSAEEQKRRTFALTKDYLESDAPAIFPEGFEPDEEYPE